MLGLLGLGALMCVSCSGKGGGKGPQPFAAGLSVKQTDVRIGLIADDGSGGPPVLEGEGFQKMSERSYVCLIEDGGGEGTLNDANRAMASGVAADSMDLRSYVMARPGEEGTASVAQVVQLSTTVLQSTEVVENVRVEMDSVLEATLSGGGLAIYEVEGEVLLEGHTMTRMSTKYHFYPQEGGVVVYLGPRDEGKTPVATRSAGGSLTVKDPSFYFKLGPGVYDLMITVKVSATCPGEGEASLKVSSRVGLRE
ncbi:MAG: hypothetical protein O3A92_16880 [Verrucomicrobia bacterium]|nr:hypothetical protein [Verrucomicrobiota bacterium]